MNGLMIIKNFDILDIDQEVLITQDYILIQEKKMIKRQPMKNIIIQKMYGKYFKTVRDLHDHFLRKDVLLLADIFKRFISTCMKYYNLDPNHCFSTPGLSWDAMLKMTKIQLEKIGDPDKHIFIEGGMRRGICYAEKKYSKANNEQCQNYDPLNQR